MSVETYLLSYKQFKFASDERNEIQLFYLCFHLTSIIYNLNK